MVPDITVPLSPNQLKRLFRKYAGKSVPVVMYDQLSRLRHIDELFRRNNGVVLFYPNLRNGNTLNGHYVALLKKGKEIHFYDPYGGMLDRTQIPKGDPQHLYEERALVRLLLESGYDVDYNPYKHQSLHNDSATCGRWSILRLLFPEIGNEEYHKLLKSKLFGRDGLSNDELVVRVIN